ncbi:ribonuclease E inhibitor RraB [Niallia taxi]|nr:ribonuclease E inhibitor RraB [Niallia taxi]MDE5055329.1 ribonuclease E inhibitor RraB [Niallia taxi]
MHFPKDEDGEVLKELFKHGLDFNQVHTVDFFVSVPDKKSGELISKIANKDGFITSVELDDNGEWTCFCSKDLLINYEIIIKIQEYLGKISLPYKGFTDGWAVMMKD